VARALQLESEFDEERRRGLEVIDHDAHVLHVLDRHALDGSGVTAPVNGHVASYSMLLAVGPFGRRKLIARSALKRHSRILGQARMACRPSAAGACQREA
jgi:hypothetical protein